MAVTTLGYCSTLIDVCSLDNIIEESDITTQIPVTIYAQFSTSDRIRKLGEYIHKALDNSEIYGEFYTNWFDVETCNGEALDAWGRIVGVDRSLILNGTAYTVDDDTYRELILWRSAVNITAPTITETNRLLTQLFGFPVGVVDNQDMTMRIVASESLDATTLNLLRWYGNLIRPMGVFCEVVIQYEAEFGFLGQNMSTFNQGVFNPADVISTLSE